MLAHELHEYGLLLLDGAREYAAAQQVEHVEHLRMPPDSDETSAESRVHIVFAAAKWCLFWAERGHGLEPWF